MTTLLITHKTTVTTFKESKPTRRAKLKSLFKPIIQKIKYFFDHQPTPLNLAKNGRSQIKFTRKIKPMKWE